MPATKDGRCWPCVQRRRHYPDGTTEWIDGEPRHLLYEGAALCSLPRRGRSRDPENVRRYQRTYSQKRTPAFLRKAWRGHLWRYHRIRPEEWAAILISQSGRCAICNDPMESPHLDHDHATGVIRGLLCQSCNHMLGKAYDDPARLRAAADYLEVIR